MGSRQSKANKATQNTQPLQTKIETNPIKDIVIENQNNQETKEIQEQKKQEKQKKPQEDNNIEIQFIQLLANDDRKNKWREYFKIYEIKTMKDLLSSYQMSTKTKTGKRLNEAEQQILNNYLLRQQKEDTVKIGKKGIKDLIRIKQIESYDNEQKIRNILIIGITGQGKSTFINSFVTAIERNFEIRAKKEKQDKEKEKKEQGKNEGKDIEILDYFEIIKIKDHGKSDTQAVTSYKFQFEDIVINLIDTPGLGDTEGLLKDQERITQISKYIEDNLHKKGQKVHAILIVSQSSTQYEVIDKNPSYIQLSMLSILKLFGIEMCGFTKHCLTFSDFTATSTQNFESEGSIFYSVKLEQNLLEQNQRQQESENQQEIDNNGQFYYQFQNSVFQAVKHGFIENIHFKKNVENYERLFNFIINQKNTGFSLEKTISVIKQRDLIEEELKGLSKKLQNFIKVLKSHNENTRKLEIYKNKIEDTKNYISIIYYPKWDKIPTSTYSTNCIKCNMTCCKGCKSREMDHCIEMINNVCNICNHPSSSHIQEDHYWEMKIKEEPKVDSILEQENQNAKKNHKEIDEKLKENTEQKEKTKEEIRKTLIEMKKCLEKLLSSALYKFDILDVEAYDFVLKFYPDYKKALDEFEIKDDFKVTKEIRETVKKNQLLVSKTLKSIETKMFRQDQLKRS